MTVLKASFRTHDEQGPVSIALVWHKHIPGVYTAPPGYVVSKCRPGHDTVLFEHTDHDKALRFAVRLYKLCEREANERAIKSVKEGKL